MSDNSTTAQQVATVTTSESLTKPGSTVVTATTASDIKPGWLTSEHMLTLLAILLVTLEGSGIIPTGSTAGQIVAMAVTVLAALGYTAARSYVKGAS